MKTIERIIGCGQVEELVEQANDELSLIEDYYRTLCIFVYYGRRSSLGRTQDRKPISIP